MSAIEAFLDAADQVLNSNTFLVKIPFPIGEIWGDLHTFIGSGELQQALQAADIARGWYNFHYFQENGELVPIPGRLAREEIRFTRRPTSVTATAYLEALLQGDRGAGNFHSFYCRPKTPAEARVLTSGLLTDLFGISEPTLYILEPDFFIEGSEDPDQVYYFEGRGCDNAALLVGATAGYLLLTNGMP